MEQEKKNLAEEKKFDLETEWLVDEYKEQQEKDRIEADMIAECLAEELADDEGCTHIDMAEDVTQDDSEQYGFFYDPSEAMSAEEFVKMIKPKAKS